MEKINLIKKDIAQAKKQYPKLIELNTKFPSLKGSLDIVDGKGHTIESFEILIQLLEQSPYCLPKVFEIGEKFDKTKSSELHINPDGSLCLMDEVNEAIIARNGIKIAYFIEKILIPNLAWRMCKIEGIGEELQERSHGVKGTLESYMEKFMTEDPNVVLLLIEKILCRNIPARNHHCFCGSERKYKLCHSQIINSVSVVPSIVLKKHYAEIKSLILQGS